MIIFNTFLHFKRSSLIPIRKGDTKTMDKEMDMEITPTGLQRSLDAKMPQLLRALRQAIAANHFQRSSRKKIMKNARNHAKKLKAFAVKTIAC